MTGTTTPLHVADAAVNGRHDPPEPYPVLSIADLANLPPLAWLVAGYLPARALTVLYGPSGVGKSFLSLDLALSVASGRPWLGHPVTAGPVLYIAAEGAHGLRQRVDAWCKHHDADPPETLHFLPDAVNLLDTGTLARAKLTLANLPDPPVLIVVDTMARCLIGGDENSARDVGQFIHNLDQLRGNAATLADHHTGKKGDDERGSSALRGAADAMHALAADAGRGGLRLECTKMKDAEPPPALALQLVAIEAANSLAIDRGDVGDCGANIGPKEAAILEHLSAAFGDDHASRTRLQAALTPHPIAERTLDRHLSRLTRLGLVNKRSEGRARFFAITAAGRDALSPHSPNTRHGEPQTVASHPPTLKGGELATDGEGHDR